MIVIVPLKIGNGCWDINYLWALDLRRFSRGLTPRDSPFFFGIAFSGVGGPTNAPRNIRCNRCLFSEGNFDVERSVSLVPMNKSYRAKWVSANYTKLMGSAEVTLPPAKEFIRAYHFTSAEFAISDIGFARLKIARISDLNDPFELLSLNFRARATRKIVRGFKDEYDSHTGLLSFSGNWTSPILWSHYATKHRGICLGFDVRRDWTQKVLYQDNRILAELDKTEDPTKIDGKLQSLLLRTKSRHWRYEKELRVFVPLQEALAEGRLHFYPFDEKLQLREVILGPQCDLSLDAVRRLTHALYPRAVTFKSRLAFKWFAVVPDETTVP